MQKNHIGGIHIAKKVALCIFLVSATLSALPESTFGATSSVFQVISKRVTISMKNATLETILAEINRQTGLDYGFQSNGSVDKNRRFTLEVTDVTVEEALNTLLKDSPYDFVLEKNRIVIVIREKKPVQLIAVTGRVVDEKGNPIPGATVLIQGTTQGVATDADGRYTINTRSEDALRISFIGYKTEVVPLKGKTKLNVRLNPTAENIEEVTVVAFGEQKKESVVSAITTVDARTLKSSSSDEDYSAYTEAEYYGYLAYASDREQRLLSGTSKNKFTKDMKGQEVELRTIAQNLSGIEEQEITLQLWVEHEDGTRAVTENGEEILKEQTFTVPVWDEKENFYIKGMRNYSGTEFDSGLMNCSLIYKIPENADLKDGDTIKFSVIDKMGKTLADDNTETQNYANVTISYQLEDSNAVPNTQTAVIPVPIGTKMDIEPPEELYGYKFVKAEGLGKIVGDDGLNIICYYEDPSGKLPVEYKVEYDWGSINDRPYGCERLL